MLRNNSTTNVNILADALREAPPALQSQLKEASRSFQNHLNEWVDHRKYIIDVLSEENEKLKNFNKACQVTGTVSTCVTAAGAYCQIPAAVPVSTFTAGMSVFAKEQNERTIVEKIQRCLNEDKKKWDHVVVEHEELQKLIKNVLSYGVCYHHDHALNYGPLIPSCANEISHSMGLGIELELEKKIETICERLKQELGNILKQEG